MTGAATLLKQDRPRDGGQAIAQGYARQWPEPRYRLAAGLQLVPGDDGGTLLCQQPLMAMRLDPAGATLLSGLTAGESRPATDLARSVPGLAAADAQLFLDALAQRRILVRDFPPPHDWPSLSVIVAAHGRPEGTRACVLSLLALDYPRERMDITIVDDASDPPLAPTLEGLPVRVMTLARNVGQSAARNLAAAEAEGDLLAFIDNDCVATPGWLRALVPHFGERDTVLVGGRVTSPPSTTTVAAFETVRSPLDMGPASGPVGPRQTVAYLPTCNMIVRRDAFLSAGGFATEMRVGEDVDLVWRILDQGGRAHYAATGDVVHDHRVRLGPLLRRRADYGASEADLQDRHPDCGRVMHLPRAGILGLAAITMAIPSPMAGAALAAAAAALVVVEMVKKRRRLDRAGLKVPMGRLVTPVLREHVASLYHLGRDVTRYYGLPLAAGFIWPALLPAIGILLLLPQVRDHARLKPALSLPVFAALSWLEMAAYQIGVWRGCIGQRQWRPLIPSIRWRP